MESLSAEAPPTDTWRSLALEAAALDPVMHSIGMRRCAFCGSLAAPGFLPDHKPDCLVLRVRALAGEHGS